MKLANCTCGGTPALLSFRLECKDWFYVRCGVCRWSTSTRQWRTKQQASAEWYDQIKKNKGKSNA